MRAIIQYPNPLLKEVSEPVRDIDSLVKDVAEEMLDCVAKPGIVGISAIQLGVKLRIIAVCSGVPILIINPAVTKASRQTYVSTEGCLSIDHGHSQYLVKRHKLVKVVGLNLLGDRVSYKGGADTFGAALQHEIDHLDGKLINDRSMER